MNTTFFDLNLELQPADRTQLRTHLFSLFRTTAEPTFFETVMPKYAKSSFESNVITVR